MKQNNVPFLFFCVFAFFFPTSLSLAAPPVILEETKEVYPLGRHLEYLEDPTRALTIEDVSSSAFDAQFIARQQDVFYVGITDSVYWARFQLQAPLREQEQWVLEIQDSYWQLIQFYFSTDTRLWLKKEGGRSLPYDRDIFLNNMTVFRLPTPLQNTQTIYLRFESEIEMVIEIRLRVMHDYQEDIQLKLFLHGIFYGILIIMAVNNLFLYLSIRDSSYLFYTLHVSAWIVCFMLFGMLFEGVGTQLFWQTPDWLMLKFVAASFCLFEIFFLFFVKSFLQTKQHTPKMDHVLSFSLVVTILGMMLFVLLAELELVGNILTANTFLMFATVLTVGILCLKQGYAPAKYFLLASTMFVGAVAISALQSLNIFPGFETGFFFIKVGGVVEAVLYSFALADRFKYERRLKEETQQRAIEEQIRMTRTFEKFVPKQFLQRISDQGIEHIELGRAQSDNISILFSDIRDFTTLSETMSPQALMNFLNEYFSRMNAPIHAFQGFIDKFIGDAIMALFDFPEQTDQEEAICAVQAAIGMQQALKAFNQQRVAHGDIPIAIGIGIHSGPVIIGTVGSADRMDSTVLGDVVNLASRVEGLTKYFRVQIILSSQTWNFVKDDDTFEWRALGLVNVKGREQPERIYEIFNADESDVRDKKRQMLDPYHQALDLYFAQQWEEAIRLFGHCLTIYPQDVVSQIYHARCQQLQHELLDGDWNGAIKLEQK